MNTQTRNCRTCGLPFSPKASGVPQVFCSRPCRTKAYEVKRLVSPNETACRICGKAMKPATGSRPRVYCSTSCRTEAWRRRHAVVNIICDQCSTVIRRHPTGVAHAEKNHFCSHACKGRWMSENLRGANHPNWKGSDVEYLSSIVRNHARGRAWAAIVLANANNTCERCGEPSAEAHHKKEVEQLLSLILDPANGEALCNNCHIEHHHQ